MTYHERKENQMKELLFLVGMLIGWAIGYFSKQRKQQSFRQTDRASQNELADAKNRARDLELQLTHYKRQEEQFNTREAQLQQKTEELQNVSEKLASAEQQIETLRQQLATTEAQKQTTADQKAEELQRVTEKLASAEQQIEKLREQSKAPEPEAESATETPTAEIAEEAAPTQPENLRKIEGIGPKVAQLLNEASILTFAQLAQTEVTYLRAILEKAGPRFKGMDPTSWPEQASLAAKEDWQGLQKLQDELDGGRYKS
jgi:predicted flap endonuclease-1-like 5' DNA nuclease